MRELDAYEAECHSCGYHWSLLEDKDNGFEPRARTCPVCQGVARYARMLRKGDKDRMNPNDPHAPDPGDGRVLSVRMLTPAETEERRRSADQLKDQ